MLKDTDLMPWGIHEGKEMQDVPTQYLMWLYDNNKCSKDVKDYIEDNLDVLEMELNKSK